MKILMIVTEKLPVPPIRGGAIQTYIAGIAPGLAEKHEITILGRTDPDLPTSEQIGKIRYERIPGGNFNLYREGVEAFLQKQLGQYDLIHIFNRPLLVKTVRSAAPAARIILSMHNDMFLPDKITPEEAMTAIAEVERIVTISQYVGNTIAAEYPQAAEKLRTIYSGVDLDRYARTDSAKKVSAALRQQHNLGNKKVILYVGRLSPKKGADILVRAMYDLAAKHKDAALVLVGSRWFSDDEISDYIAYVRSLAERSPLPVVTTGYVPNQEVHQWYWAGDVFVCPSQWQEPLARVHYEAMAASLPIITTARGGNPEVIIEGGNGLLVQTPENPREFADKLSALFKDPGKMQQMGRTGRTMAEQKYGWKRVIQEILEVWG
jgi:spore coat protein SA